jgi:hypothetical protein
MRRSGGHNYNGCWRESPYLQIAPYSTSAASHSARLMSWVGVNAPYRKISHHKLARLHLVIVHESAEPMVPSVTIRSGVVAGHSGMAG